MYPSHRFLSKKWQRRIAAGIACASLLTFLPAAPAPMLPISVSYATASEQVMSTNWTPRFRAAMQEFYCAYGKDAKGYNAAQRPYAVFDFDNTTSILDVEEQLTIWQLDHLAFAIPPQKMKEVLLTGIPAESLTLTYGAQDGDGTPTRIVDAIDDAAEDYAQLCAKGYVTADGTELSDAAKSDADYLDFKAKMRWLYDAIGETMDASVSYPWVTYWFTGMRPDQVYALAYRCDSYYGNPALGQTWTKGSYASPAQGKAGAVSVSYKLGITVTPEIRELYADLAENGIDVWINSASPLDVVRAAKDFFVLPEVKGIVAMTNKLDKNGRYINVYDEALHPQTQGVGKAETIAKVIAPQYGGHGPIFCAMDSQGDFNFCTEFKDTKAVLVLNRKRTDDAALCAGIAEAQAEKGTTLLAANCAGDTLFLLQGRDENRGGFWPDTKALLLGKKEAAYLSEKGEKAKAEIESGKRIRDVLAENTKLKNYQGYKTR